MENNIDSFDPTAWANIKECRKELSKTNKEDFRVKDSLSEESEIREVASRILNRGIDITQGYDKWLSLGFALVDGLGEDGREIYHQLSQMNGGYDAAECDKQYDNCMRSHGSGVTVKTFFQMAKEAGVDIAEVAREQLLQSSASATCANAPSAKRIENIDNNNDLGNLDYDLALGGLADVADSASSAGNGYTFSDKLNPDDLDYFSRIIYDNHKAEPAKCDAMLLGAYNIISGLMGGANRVDDEKSGVYGIYDGRRVGASLYNIIYSGAGNDKGNLVFCTKLAEGVKREMMKEYKDELAAYEVEMAEWEAMNKKGRGPAPKEPVYRDPFVPGNSSSSAVYRAMEANGGWGMMFETEADTVANMIKSDYGNYSDMMRKAHHHEPITMNRVTDKIHIDIPNPRFSVLLTCTPGQLPALFPSFENGLGSRFLFYNIPDSNVQFHNVFAKREKPIEDVYREMGNDMLTLYHGMQQRKNHPVQFVLSQEQQNRFIAEFQDMLQEQFAMLGKGISAFVFRIALECFRYAMILSTLRKFSEWKADFSPSTSRDIFPMEENALVCNDKDFDTAMTIVRCLIFHTARVYAILSKDDDNPFAQRGIHLSRDEMKLYNALPEGDFRTSEMLEIARGLGISERSAQRIFSKFANVHRIIIPMRKGFYNKPLVNTTEDGAGIKTRNDGEAE